MTPAINLLKRAKINHKVHEYTHDAQHESFGLEAAEKLNIAAERVFKTLVVKLDNGQLAVGILPVNQMLSMKAIAKALNAKKAEMADKTEVQRSTGYVLGGVSPLAQKKRLKTVVDLSAQQFPSIFVSGGRRGLEIELAALELVKVTQGQFFNIGV
jgi:Cys-tRNA(Pro)/Cys-tRNA(Cys) deacylase